MKVLQLLPELNSGGVERGTLELGRHLVQEGHESLVISNGGRLVATLEADGSRHLTRPVHRKSLLSLREVRPLRRIFAEERPDIIHARSRLPAWLAFLAWRKMDPASRPRFVTTVHGFNSVNAYSRIMTRGERVICVSNAIREFVRQNYPGCPEETLVVIHRGIDPSEYPRDFRPPDDWLASWHREFPATDGKRLLVLPGRVTRLKGHHDFLRLLQALAPEYPDLHGVIAGGVAPGKEAYGREVAEEIATLGLDGRVTLAGERSDLREILALATISYSLSQKPESFGRTVLESLALGTPVIGYDHGGAGEILQALLPEGGVPRHDHDALCERTRRFLDAPPAIAPDHPFTREKMLAGTVAVYEALLR
ncbi:MAG: glycosyltransferase family 4 protein [Akkermansiaceae bacterium]|nr:glycosyltransferase family 4 protein [Akkermansiaceae bacterium]